MYIRPSTIQVLVRVDARQPRLGPPPMVLTSTVTHLQHKVTTKGSEKDSFFKM